MCIQMKACAPTNYSIFICNIPTIPTFQNFSYRDVRMPSPSQIYRVEYAQVGQVESDTAHRRLQSWLVLLKGRHQGY